MTSVIKHLKISVGYVYGTATRFEHELGIDMIHLL